MDESATGRQDRVLSFAHVTKTFGATTALSDVSMDVLSGQIHALLGHNGSGKSTLIKILSGYFQPDMGSVTVGGRKLTYPIGSRELRELGVGILQQDVGLVPSLSVVDNLLISSADTAGFGWIKRRAEKQTVAELFESFGMSIDPERTVQSLRPAERVVTGILRALRHLDGGGERHRLIVLDEPTSSLDADGVERLFGVMRKLADEGAGVLFVTHRLDEVLGVAHQVTVLRDGRVYASDAVTKLTKESLAKLITGEADVPRSAMVLHNIVSHEARSPRPAVEAVINGPGLRGPAEITIRSGEVLGVTGVEGSGYQLIPSYLYGAREMTAGRVAINGKTIRHPRPDRCVREGIGFVSGDRARAGGAPRASVLENLTLPTLDSYVRGGGVISGVRERAAAARMLETYDVRPRLIDISFGALSGGNQQKALVARRLESKPDVLLLDEPTTGVDVKVREDLFNIFRAFTRAGGSILFASAQYEDIVRVADRVIVFKDGAQVAELERDITIEKILSACYGLEPNVEM